jgi:hypothetical protein
MSPAISISNFRNTCANPNRSSAHAKLTSQHISIPCTPKFKISISIWEAYFIPKHILGPLENATNQFSNSLDPSQRSGLKVSGEGKMLGL